MMATAEDKLTLETLLDRTGQRGVATSGGSLGAEVRGLTSDSRKVEPGFAFFAVSGSEVDGNAFAADAAARGATAVISQQDRPEGFDDDVAWVTCRQLRELMGRSADAFFDQPSAAMRVVGVTGTNGKTTTAFLIHHLLRSAWHRSGLMGSVHNQIGERAEPARLTTPDVVEVHRLLGAMRDEGCRGAAMEVSSHGLDQGRVEAVRFAVAVFTNLSQDHLDYHRTLPRYFEAKRKLFRQLDEIGSGGEGRKGELAPVAVINRDDPYGEKLAAESYRKARVVTYGQGVRCDFRASRLQSDFNGSSFQLEHGGRSLLVRLPQIGRFNTYNALAALAAVHGLDLNLREAIRHLADAPQVPGRMESVDGQQTSFRVYVDYAHTPDALINALKTLRELEPRRIITVFGCGGDRDRGKRPLMGRAVEEHSDLAILTSDNPRGEKPEAIAAEVEAGMRGGRHAVVLDRKEAIGEAIARARTRDIVLIAGKGHEDYQEIEGERLPFDDRRVARGFITRRLEAAAEDRLERDREREQQDRERRRDFDSESERGRHE